MAIQKLTRFDTIFDSKELALESLRKISRDYSECVASRYYIDNNIIGILVVVFKSDNVGDFEVLYDSEKASIEDIHYVHRFFSVKKSSPDESDEESIKIALFGNIPNNFDIIRITSYNEDYLNTYIYYDDWQLIGTTYIKPEINPVNTDTIIMTLNDEGELRANVKLDNTTIKYDSNVNGITVKKIYGGTF